MDGLKGLIGGVPSQVSDFDVTQHWAGRTLVVAVAGDLDMLTAPRLNDAIVAAAGQQPAAIIVDLTTVTFLASAGLNVLLVAQYDITPGAQFGIVAKGAVRRPLQLTGLDTVVMLFPTLDDALAGLSVEPEVAL